MVDGYGPEIIGGREQEKTILEQKITTFYTYVASLSRELSASARRKAVVEAINERFTEKECKLLEKVHDILWIDTEVFCKRTGQEVAPPSLREDIRRIVILEEKNPGIGKRIFEKYGYLPKKDVSLEEIQCMDTCTADFFHAFLEHFDNTREGDIQTLINICTGLESAIQQSNKLSAVLEIFDMLEKNTVLLRKIRGLLSELHTYAIDDLLEELRNKNEYLNSVAQRNSLFITTCRRSGIINQEKTVAEKEKLETALALMLGAKGLNVRDCLEAWQSTTIDNQQTIEKNLYAIDKLEQAMPGSAAKLYKQFGIRHFARYPQKLLLRQAEYAENDTVPYGIALYPTADRNGTFSYDEKMFTNLSNDLKGIGCELRVMEVKGKHDIGRRFFMLRDAFPTHLIEFAVIGGHGDAESITLGGDQARETLSKKDLTGRGMKRIGGFFVHQPSIVLVSCSTGKESGIGQEISSIFGAEVTAPKEDAARASIRAQKRNGKIILNATYNVEKNQYLQGRS